MARRWWRRVRRRSTSPPPPLSYSSEGATLYYADNALGTLNFVELDELAVSSLLARGDGDGDGDGDDAAAAAVTVRRRRRRRLDERSPATAEQRAPPATAAVRRSAGVLNPAVLLRGLAPSPKYVAIDPRDDDRLLLVVQVGPRVGRRGRATPSRSDARGGAPCVLWPRDAKRSRRRHAVPP